MARPRGRPRKEVEMEEKEVTIKSESVPVPDEKKNTVALGQEEVKKRHPGPWVRLTDDQVEQHSKAGTLFGYDPKTKEGIIIKK